MESAVQYGSVAARPRLTVVKDGEVAARFSALPHEVIRRKDISCSARLLVAVLQMYAWKDGECRASHATMAADMGCGLRSLRAYLDELIGAGIVTERDAGVRRQKVYALSFNTSKLADWNEPNTSESADCEPSNAQVLHVQSASFDSSNTSKLADSKKKTTGKKTLEEDKSTAPTEPAPKPTRSGELIDALRAHGIPVTMLPQDHKALKDSGADPSLVAEAYGAIFRGEWGDDFMRRSLSVLFVIKRLGAYESWKRNPKASAQQRNGSADRMPPGAASKQRSKWSDPEVMKQWRGKVGGSGAGGSDVR